MKIEAYQSTDVYLLDQIMKGRYQPGASLLDAGAGSGRNLKWFLENDFQINAIDQNPESQLALLERYENPKVDWTQSDLGSLPFPDASFDHVVCVAVLHFARNKEHFQQMWSELKRVCKSDGTLFIRTCVSMGILDRCTSLGEGRFLLPDESERYLLHEDDMHEMLRQVTCIEPPKWVNVANQRVMLTLMIQNT